MHVFSRGHSDCSITALCWALDIEYVQAAAIINIPLNEQGEPVCFVGRSDNEIVYRLFRAGFFPVRIVTSEWTDPENKFSRTQDLMTLPELVGVLAVTPALCGLQYADWNGKKSFVHHYTGWNPRDGFDDRKIECGTLCDPVAVEQVILLKKPEGG